MSMQCKKCGESFPKGQPFDTFELRRHKMFPSEDGMTHSDQMEDAGVFCSRKCLGDYLKSEDKSGVFDLSKLRSKLDDQR